MHFARAAILGLALLAAPHSLAGQAAADGPAVTQSDNAAFIEGVRQRLVERYVIPATGQALADALARAEAAGRFRGLTGEHLAAAVNAVMREVTPDGHLVLQYDPAHAAVLTQFPEGIEDAELAPEQVRGIELNNGGVRKLEVLPGNIRYMEYTGFMWGSPATEAAIAGAMEFLRGGSAAIIDLRRNGGGSPAAVAAMTGYFVPEGTPLMRFDMRGRSEQATVAGAAPFSLAGMPIYVLTSKQTFSAAEEFSAHVDAFGFAKLIGETTGGGGFRNDLFAHPGGFVLSVSTGQAVQVKSGKGWERTGIAPAIAVPEANALDMARAEAVAAIMPAAPEGERQAYERLLPYYRALALGAEAARPLAAYAGTYGERSVSVDGAGNLTSRRGGQPASRLVPLGGDEFAPENSPAQRFRFVAGDGGVTALEVEGGGGTQRSERAAG